MGAFRLHKILKSTPRKELVLLFIFFCFPIWNIFDFCFPIWKMLKFFFLFLSLQALILGNLTFYCIIGPFRSYKELFPSAYIRRQRLFCLIEHFWFVSSKFTKINSQNKKVSGCFCYLDSVSSSFSANEKPHAITFFELAADTNILNHKSQCSLFRPPEDIRKTEILCCFLRELKRNTG